MAEQFDALDETLVKFIAAQHIFFTATAGPAGRVNVSPKGMDSLRVLVDRSDGARQVYDVNIDLVQTSCGYAVPFMDFAGDRDVLTPWTANKGPEGIAAFWETRNARTIDNDPAYILDEPGT